MRDQSLLSLSALACNPWQSLGYSQIRREDGGTTRTLTMQALLSLHCIMP